MIKASGSGTDVYQLALHAAPVGIMMVGDRGDIQYVNQTLADMFGHSVDDLLGKPVDILIPEPFVVAHRDHVKNYTRRPKPRSMGAGRDLEGVTGDNLNLPQFNGYFKSATMSLKEYPNHEATTTFNAWTLPGRLPTPCILHSAHCAGTRSKV